MRHFHLVAAIIALLMLSATAARADSWALPRETIVKSPDRAVRLVITPRRLSSQLDYFRDKVAGRDPAGQAPGDGSATATARLERRTFPGIWRTVWRAPLVNEVAPGEALVANGGRYVVTFDEWHMVGFGDHVVVIYGPDGRLIRSLKLQDILPEDYIYAIPRSISSIWWGGEHALSEDGERLILRIVVPSGGSGSDEDETVPLVVDLASGAVAPPSGPQWSAALARARVIAAEERAREAAERVAFIAPLLGPQTDDEEAWLAYLGEAFARLEPASEESFPRLVVVPSRFDNEDNADAPLQESGIASAALAFADAPEDPEGAILVASTKGAGHLMSVLTRKIAQTRPGSLDGVRVYVAAPAAYREAIAALLRPSGADFHLLDPAEPIPQRPERLARIADR